MESYLSREQRIINVVHHQFSVLIYILITEQKHVHLDKTLHDPNPLLTQ